MIQWGYAAVADRMAFCPLGRWNGRKLLIFMLDGAGSEPVTPAL